MSSRRWEGKGERKYGTAMESGRPLVWSSLKFARQAAVLLQGGGVVSAARHSGAADSWEVSDVSCHRSGIVKITTKQA